MSHYLKIWAFCGIMYIIKNGGKRMGKIKVGPVVEFDKDSITDELLKYEFKTKEDITGEWCQSVVDATNYQDFEEKRQGREVNLFGYYFDGFMADFTIFPQDRKTIIEQAIALKKASNGWIKNFSVSNNQIKFLTKDGDIGVGTLSRIFPLFKKIKPEIETEDRYGRCHYDAIQSALKIADEHFVVTGYVAPLSQYDKSLHSWVEMKTSAGWVVMDPSRNLLLSREWYYKLRGITAINRISNAEIKRDLDILNALREWNWLLVKLYLANPELAKEYYQKRIMENEQ